MGFLTVVFLCVWATFVSSALTGNPKDGAGMSAPVGSTGSKWDDFTSFIGEEVVMAAKHKLMKKTHCCLEIDLPAEMKNAHLKCLFSSVKITVQELGDGTAKTPTTSDWKRWVENSIDCLIKELNITTNATDVDKASIKQEPVERWFKKDDDKVAVRTIFNGCADKSTGPTPIRQMISMQSCVIDGITSLCIARGEPVGLMLKVVKGLLTFWDVSQCSGVQIPQKFDDTVTTCVAKAGAKWQADGLGKFTSSSMMIYNNSDVKNAMYFLKMYGKNFLMELLECGSEEMGFYNDTTGMFNYKAGADFLTNLQGWSSPQVMNSVVTAFKGCEVSQNETELAKMDEMEQDMSVLKTMMKFKKCFMSKFVQICGMNNDVAQVFFPVLNNKLVGEIGKDFKDKKVLLAIMHIIPALKEKFSDIDAVMNNMSMMASGPPA